MVVMVVMVMVMVVMVVMVMVMVVVVMAAPQSLSVDGVTGQRALTQCLLAFLVRLS